MDFIKKYYIWIGILLVCIFFVIWYFSKEYTILQTKGVDTPTPIISLAPKIPSDPFETQVRKAKQDLIQLVYSKGPGAALTKLEELSNSSNNILANCHSIGHEIGRAAYKKYFNVDTALEYATELCGSAYIHGVIEERTARSKDIFTEIKKMCQPNSGNCFHAVGHGLMYYTGNDIPKAVQICDTLFTNAQKSFCSEGIFMEHFNTDISVHLDKYLSETNVFYPCSDQKLLYKGACYFYAPDYYLHLHRDDYIGILTLCNSVEQGFVLTCINGIGSRTMKRNIKDPKFVESICMHAKPDQAKYCIDGMTSYYLVHFYSLEKGKELCNMLEDSNKPQCFLSVENRKKLFPD